MEENPVQAGPRRINTLTFALLPPPAFLPAHTNGQTQAEAKSKEAVVTVFSEESREQNTRSRGGGLERQVEDK